MQIHELPNYAGDLNDGYVVLDNGTETGRLKGENFFGPVNDRIDNIITSPAPTEQEIIDARTGANNENYSSLGASIRTQISNIRNYNSYNIINGFTHTNNTIAGVSFSWNGDKVTTSGTATASGWHVVYNNTNGFPTGMKAGGSYFVVSMPSSKGVILQLRYYKSDGTNVIFYQSPYQTGFTIPSNAVGLAIRLIVLSGKTYNETFTLNIAESLSNHALSETSVRYTDIYVKSTGGDFTTVEYALKCTMDYPPTYNSRYRIFIDAGTYDLTPIIAHIGGQVDQRGLYIMPYTEIYGAGKDNTILEFHYNGASDTIMTMVSAINAPYTCKVSNLTISAKNIRYAVHSDNALSSESSSLTNTKLNDTEIIFENVRMIHEGFDSNLTPSYKVPAAWGGGSWDNSKRVFKNCEFISKGGVTAFLNHDRVGITRAGEFIFDECIFINDNTGVLVGPAYAGASFISWGSGADNVVLMNGCHTNKFIGLTVVTSQGNANAKIDYYVKADNDILIAEQNTNDSHRQNNYINNNCVVRRATSALSSYSPIGVNAVGNTATYSSAFIKGILLHDVSAGNECVIQIKGLIFAPLLNIPNISSNTKYKYEAGAWSPTLGDDWLVRTVYGTELAEINPA